METNAIEQVKIPLEVVIGRTMISLADISKLGEGSIIELGTLAGEPVELVAAGEVIGRGEVVVIDENFGVRVTDLKD